MWSRGHGGLGLRGRHRVSKRGREASGKLSQRWWSLGPRKAFVPPGCPHTAHQSMASFSHTACTGFPVTSWGWILDEVPRKQFCLLKQQQHSNIAKPTPKRNCKKIIMAPAVYCSIDLSVYTYVYWPDWMVPVA